MKQVFIKLPDDFSQDEILMYQDKSPKYIAVPIESADPAIRTLERIKAACLAEGLLPDDFIDEVVEAMDEYLYDTNQEWEENIDG